MDQSGTDILGVEANESLAEEKKLLEEIEKAAADPLKLADLISDLTSSLQNTVGWEISPLEMLEDGWRFLKAISDEAVQAAVLSYCQDYQERPVDGRPALFNLLFEHAAFEKKEALIEATKMVLRSPRDIAPEKAKKFLAQLVRVMPEPVEEDPDFLRLWVGDHQRSYDLFHASWKECYSAGERLPLPRTFVSEEGKILLDGKSQPDRRAGAEILRGLVCSLAALGHPSLPNIESAFTESPYSDVRAQYPGVLADALSAMPDWVGDQFFRCKLSASIGKIHDLDMGVTRGKVFKAKLAALSRLASSYPQSSAWGEVDISTFIRAAKDRGNEDAFEALVAMTERPDLFTREHGLLILEEAEQENRARCCSKYEGWPGLLWKLAEEQNRAGKINYPLMWAVTEKAVSSGSGAMRDTSEHYLHALSLRKGRKAVISALKKAGLSAMSPESIKRAEKTLSQMDNWGTRAAFARGRLVLRRIRLRVLGR